MIKCNRGVAREGPTFFTFSHVILLKLKRKCVQGVGGGGGGRGNRIKENFSDTSAVSESLLAIFSSIHVHWDMVKFSGEELSFHI